jgi:hypothetical protein
MNGYYQFASADSVIIMVPSSEALSTDPVGAKARIPPHRCDRYTAAPLVCANIHLCSSVVVALRALQRAQYMHV